MAFRRRRALVCLLSFLAGLVATGARPVLAETLPSYASGDYGTGVGVTVQQRGYSFFPAIIGGVAGLAIGGAAMGPVGALAGGVGGFALGNAVADKFGPDLGTIGYPQRINTGLMASLIPGMAGAVLGLVVTASMGPLAWVIGGVAGFFVGQFLARVIFPQMYYGGNVYPVERTYQYSAPTVQATVTRQSTPSAPTTSLVDLKKTFYDAMSTYRQALTGGSEGDQHEARALYLKAQQDYFDAKRALAGAEE